MKDENESNGDSNLIIVEPYLKNDESISDNLSFTLDMKNIPYKISLSRTKNNIFFTYQNYELKLNLNEFKYTNILFNVCRNIDDIFKLLVTVFNRKKVKIKEIKENQMITLE